MARASTPVAAHARGVRPLGAPVLVQLANATFAARQPHVWGESTTTVASDSTHFRAYDQNLFTEWHSRYGGRGVLIYWHIEKKSMAVHSQLLSCAASEVAAMVEGAVRHGTTMALSAAQITDPDG
jgi:TnpA family transposase